jgi:rare lipoprotein A
VTPPGPEAVPAKPTARVPSRPPQVVLKRGGGFYKDDGPADEIPDNLDEIPDAEPRWEPIHRPATRPYVVLGREYFPNATVQPYKARGIASWYGKKFHGQKTSIGERYDMFAMTAAHTTLALPSYARVTNPRNGRSVVVRITDRGPFHIDRIIDLSYTAAYKLDIIGNGSGEVEVEAIVPGATPGPVLAQSSAARPASQRDEIAELANRMLGEEVAPKPGPETGRGVFLQLGAFANADNAETLKNRLTSELEWLTEPLRIYPAGGIHRLQLGPYSSRGDAERVAEKIRLALGYKPTLVNR